MSREHTEKKWVIEMMGNAYPFFVSEIKHNGDPSFTANIGEALSCKSCAGAYIEIEKIKKAGFLMELKARPLTIKYTLGVE